METTPQTTTARPSQHFNGSDISFFLRVNHITIRSIAAHMQITLKRVRQVCKEGVSGISCTDWSQAIRELAVA